MPRYGFTLLSELHGPVELVDQARRAEEAGFDFLAVSDHFHPWLDSHGHSPFAWTVLGGVAQATSRIELATMVTCPFGRYHPAVVAQAAATVGVLSGGRFTLGLGSGERLNEHITGDGWPSVRVRHDMLAESVAAIRELWSGEWVDLEGDYVVVDSARIFDVPEPPPDLYIGVSGPASVDLALELDVGICMVDAQPDLVSQYRENGGAAARTWGQVALSWDRDGARAQDLAHERFRFGVSGWKVMSELPNVVNFEAATATVTTEQVTQQVTSGPDPAAMVDAVTRYIEAGLENVAVVQVGDDVEGFLRAWEGDIRPKLP